LINGYGDGDTLYVGARGKNSSMLRIYDKGAESKEEIYEGATRYEVELSDTHARQGYEAVREAGYGHGACLAVAMSYFAVKGVRIPVPPGTPIIEAWSLPKAQSNLEGRLKWLRESVAPALDLLREAGYSEHNIAAVLGLEV
jgi:DNA relaxase NicK